MGTKTKKNRKTATAKTVPAKKPKQSPKPKSPKPKSAKPTSTKVAAKSKESYRQPTDWTTLKKMWEGGATYEEMAQKTDSHYDPNRPDATKPTRAKISRAHTKGIMIGGKLVHFGARGKVKTEKKASQKPKATSEKKVNPVPTAKKEVGQDHGNQNEASHPTQTG
jgi:hypothetical protein